MRNDTGVRPLGNQVLVRRVAPESMSGHLHVPEYWPNIGIVLAVGRRVKASDIVGGMRVMFRSRPSSALVPDTLEPGQRPEWERCIMLREEDILCILEN